MRDIGIGSYSELTRYLLRVGLRAARLRLLGGALLVLLAVVTTGHVRVANAAIRPSTVRLAPAAAASTLSVAGNHLVDNGNVVILRGVNRSGGEYACYQGFGFFDGPVDDASIAAIASWGTNVVRVPFNEDCGLGINGFPAAFSGANYRAAVTGFVTRLRAHGLYVILSNQVAGAGTTQSTTILPMPDADHAPAAWTSVASTFASDKGVIFDLYNEPHDVSWSCWANGCQVTGGVNFVAPYMAAGMKSLTTAVRNARATNVIMVGGLSCINDPGPVTGPDGWLANRPSDTQLMVSVHNYDETSWNTSAIWDNIYAPIAQQVPVTFGEMGMDVYIEKLMPWADAHGIGYLAWTWETRGDYQSLISNYDGTPTTYGLGFKNYLAALKPVTVPGAPTNVNATVGDGAAGVSWTAPASSVPITSYVVTAYDGCTIQGSQTASGTRPAPTLTSSGPTNRTAYALT